MVGTVRLQGFEGGVGVLLQYIEDGAVDVRKWTSEVLCNVSRGLARARREGRLEEEDLPIWPKKTFAGIWRQVSEEHEAWNDFMNAITWKSTFGLRHVLHVEQACVTKRYVGVGC